MIRNPFRDLDQKKLSRSSDVLKTQNDYFKIVNRRIFIFGIIICLICRCFCTAGFPADKKSGGLCSEAGKLLIAKADGQHGARGDGGSKRKGHCKDRFLS